MLVGYGPLVEVASDWVLFSPGNFMSYSLWGNGEMGVLRGVTLPILRD